MPARIVPLLDQFPHLLEGASLERYTTVGDEKFQVGNRLVGNRLLVRTQALRESIHVSADGRSTGLSEAQVADPFASLSCQVAGRGMGEVVIVESDHDFLRRQTVHYLGQFI